MRESPLAVSVDSRKVADPQTYLANSAGSSSRMSFCGLRTR